MCAAGVVDATPYGTYLFILKILNIYLFGFWLVLHYLDIKKHNFKVEIKSPTFHLMEIKENDGVTMQYLLDL